MPGKMYLVQVPREIPLVQQVELSRFRGAEVQGCDKIKVRNRPALQYQVKLSDDTLVLMTMYDNYPQGGN